MPHEETGIAAVKGPLEIADVVGVHIDVEVAEADFERRRKAARLRHRFQFGGVTRQGVHQVCRVAPQQVFVRPLDPAGGLVDGQPGGSGCGNLPAVRAQHTIIPEREELLRPLVPGLNGEFLRPDRPFRNFRIDTRQDPHPVFLHQVIPAKSQLHRVLRSDILQIVKKGDRRQPAVRVGFENPHTVFFAVHASFPLLKSRSIRGGLHPAAAPEPAPKRPVPG